MHVYTVAASDVMSRGHTISGINGYVYFHAIQSCTPSALQKVQQLHRNLDTRESAAVSWKVRSTHYMTHHTGRRTHLNLHWGSVR